MIKVRVSFSSYTRFIVFISLFLSGCSDTEILYKVASLFSLPELNTIADQNVNEEVSISSIQPAFKGLGTEFSDMGIAFSCYYDSTIDGTVNEISSCDDIRDLSFSTNNGKISWIPNRSQSGDYEFRIIATKDNSIREVIFNIQVNDTVVNRAPTITSLGCSGSILQNSSLSCAPTATDLDGDNFTYALAPDNGCDWAAIADPNTGSISGTPNDDDVGTCDLKMVADDGFVISSSYSETITITNVAPTFTLSLFSSVTPVINEDDPLTEVASDVSVQVNEEGQGTYALNLATSTCDENSDGGTSLNIDTNTGAVTYKPSSDFNGTCTVTVDFDDGNTGGLVSDSFVVTINPVNDVPVLTHSCSTTTFNQYITYNCVINSNDVDGDVLTLTQNTNTCSSWATVTAHLPSSGQVTVAGTPSNNDVGACSLTVRADDGNSGIVDEVFNFTINNVAPTLYLADATILKGSIDGVIQDAQANEEADGSTTYTLEDASTTTPKCSTNANSGPSINPSTGEINFEPATTFSGPCHIKVKFDDGNGDNVSHEFKVHVQEVIDAYRSVGPTLSASTLIINGDSDHKLTVAGSLATFTKPIIDRVGVGDVISYDSTNDSSLDNIAFIVERINDKQYRVQHGDPEVFPKPNASHPYTDDWQIHRAYASLSDVNNNLENTNINSSLRDFDNTSDKNLVSKKRNLKIAVYGGVEPGDKDTIPVSLSSWVTDSNHRLKIYAPFDLSEVGVTQRHNGSWNSNLYRLAVNGAHALFLGTSNYVSVDGLQIEMTSLTASLGQSGIQSNPSATNEIIITNNLIHAKSTSSFVANGIYINYAPTFTKIFNNMILLDSTNTNSKGMYLNEDIPGEKEVYNNTVLVKNLGKGIYTAGSGVLAKNNLVQCDNSFGNCYSGTFDSSSAKNLSGDTTAPGTSPFTSKPGYFIDPEKVNLRLSYTTKAFYNAFSVIGEDLSTHFNKDIDGKTRVGGWTVGAFQFFADLQTCPPGFILIKGNATFSTNDFCVSKYEIKNVATSPKSVVTNIPWTNDTRANFISKCSSMTPAAHLITNNEWQTIARDIASVSHNWHETKIKQTSSFLNRGNKNTTSPCDAIHETVTSSCTGSGGSFIDKRTHVLSNGNTIWDFSGNVSEWVQLDSSSDYTGGQDNFLTSPSNYVSEISTINVTAQQEFGPTLSYGYTTSPYGNLGQIIGISGQNGFTFTRGGHTSSTYDIGVFHAEKRPNTNADLNIGFRCVYIPQAIP